MSKMLRNFFRSKKLRMFGMGAALLGTLVVGMNVAEEIGKTPQERAYDRQFEMVMSKQNVDGRTIMVEYFDSAGTNHTLQVTIDATYKLDDKFAADRVLMRDTAEGFHEGLAETLSESIRDRMQQQINRKNPTAFEVEVAMNNVETELRHAVSYAGPRVPLIDLDLSASIPRGDLAHDSLREVMTQEGRFVQPQMPNVERIIADTGMGDVERERSLTEAVQFNTRALTDLAERIDRLVENTRDAKPRPNWDIEFIDDAVTAGFLNRLDGMAEQIRGSAALDGDASLAEQALATKQAYDGHIEALQQVIIGYKLSPEARAALQNPTPAPGQ